VTDWVIDTSPLLFLAKLGHLELLRKSAETICIPQAVLDEVQTVGTLGILLAARLRDEMPSVK
jgi:predicted nucleic acid-binding protein